MATATILYFNTKHNKINHVPTEKVS